MLFSRINPMQIDPTFRRFSVKQIIKSLETPTEVFGGIEIGEWAVRHFFP